MAETRRTCRYIPRSWNEVTDLGLIFWIIRIPVGAFVLGFVLLCLVPQAQDLLVELIESYWRVVLFLLLVFFVWASSTHYAARLLLDTDDRFRARVTQQRSDFIGCCETWIPRLLGVLTFVAVLLSAQRSINNLPDIEDEGVISHITAALRWFQLLTFLVMAVFVWYVVKRK